MFKIDNKYNSDILLYCELNKIQDINTFVTQCFKQGFDIKKYGLLGKTLNDGEKDLKTGGDDKNQVEVIREIRVEVPVEVIKEVEKIIEVVVEKEVIKEVPVDRVVEVEKVIEVVKEVPVEKVVTKVEYITDKTTEDELGGIIAELKNEMSKKDKKIDELRHNLDIALDKPPVEIIKEVEVIKEVERPNDKTKMLGETLMKLRTQVKEKDDEIDQLKGLVKQLETRLNPTGAVYMKGSNINDNL